MTPEELWRAVGEILLLQRNRKDWNASDVERHGGPTYKTVEKIEKGLIGNVDKLAMHAEALGLALVDVLRTALAKTTMPLSPEALQVVRKFEMTTIDGRQAFLQLARALPDAASVPPTPSQLPGAPPKRGPRKT